MSGSIYERAVKLIGKPSRDPDVLAFLREEGLGGPPIILKRDGTGDAKHPDKHFELDFNVDVHVPELQPVRRDGGQYVAYVTGVRFEAGFAEAFGDGLSMTMTRDQAAARALEKRDTPRVEVFIMRRQGQVIDRLTYKKKDGALYIAGAFLEQRDRTDAELVAARAKVVPDATKPRVMPTDVGPAAKEGYPGLLRQLVAARSEGSFGELDLEFWDAFSPGGPKAWTGNPDAEKHFRVFGRDGTGSLLAFWLVEAGKPLEQQPIVFLESEGQLGIIAKDLNDFIAELADGVGPLEVVSYGTTVGEPIAAVRAIADKIPALRGRRAVDALLEAHALYGDFEDTVRAMIKH